MSPEKGEFKRTPRMLELEGIFREPICALLERLVIRQQISLTRTGRLLGGELRPIDGTTIAEWVGKCGLISKEEVDKRHQLEQIGLSPKAFYPLSREGLSPDQIRQMSDEQLLAIRNFGEKRLQEVRAKLQE